MKRTSAPRAPRVLAGLVAIGGMLLSVGAGTADAASVRQKQSFDIWQQQDKCADDAFKKFPDYTAAAIRRRNAAMHACDAAHNLPPRADFGTSPVHRIPDADAD
jgi:hypothetical protein